MESKNVKVIDEHSIDRDANIICAFDVEGSDYVTYWIERDAENDNIFVSKLIKNIDGTSNMLNIEDSSEKENISSLVRELVKYAVDTEGDKLSEATLTLPSGKTVKISSVLINKEQNINVQRTYITTVKKSVTKVSEDFYDINVQEKVEETVVKPEVTPVSVAPVSEPEVVIPMVEAPVTTETPVVEPVVAPVTPVIPEVQPVVVETPVEAPVMEEKTVEPVVIPSVLPVQPVSVEPEVVVPTEIKPETVTPVMPVEPIPMVEDTKTNILGVNEESQEIKVEPVVLPTPEVAPVSEPVPTPVDTTDRLVFDASKETNLNQALGEVTKEATIPVSDIEPVREFGVDEPEVVTPVVSAEPLVQPEVVSQEDIKVRTKKMGFANNKFFMIVAIAFFMASCIFLGYEVFRFFQLK